MRDAKFIVLVRNILKNNLQDVSQVNIIETNKAEIAFTYNISALHRTKEGYLSHNYWKVVSSSKDEALAMLPYVVEAKEVYPEAHAKILLKRFGSTKEALESAIRSRNSNSLFSLDYHKWNEIINDINNLV